MYGLERFGMSKYDEISQRYVDDLKKSKEPSRHQPRHVTERELFARLNKAERFITACRSFMMPNMECSIYDYVLRQMEGGDKR